MRSTRNRGMAKSASMANADTYSERHAKLERPLKNCTAALNEVARKNAKLRQNMLNVKMRWPQRLTKLRKGRAELGSVTCFLLGNRMRSMDKTKPWIAPKIANVQLAPCHRPASTIVAKRFRDVFHVPPALPPKGMYK